MNHVKLKLSCLYSGKERRQPLMDVMDRLEKNGINCFECKGICCSYERNAMQVTPLEGFEVLEWLIEQGRWSPDTRQKLVQNIEHFRLDKEIFVGKGRTMRKYYSCPFYVPGAQGCTLSRSVKPYGCLAFNSDQKSCQRGEYCSSDQDLLQKRESLFQQEEKRVNQVLRESLSLLWEKTYLPIAILEIDEKINSTNKNNNLRNIFKENFVGENYD